MRDASGEPRELRGEHSPHEAKVEPPVLSSHLSLAATIYKKPPPKSRPGQGLKNSSPAFACRTGRSADDPELIANAQRGRLRPSHGNDHPLAAGGFASATLPSHAVPKWAWQYAAVALGGACGAVARLLVAQLSGRFLGTGFPIGTFIINISGSCFIGWFLTLRARFSETLVFGVAVGFVGAYTTFSTYMFESNGLIENGAWIKAGFNLVGSVIAGLLAVRLGIYLAAK